VGDDDVIAGGRSVQDDLLVGVRAGSPVDPKHLVVLRHAERLHGLAVFGFHALDLQSGSAEIQDHMLCFHIVRIDLCVIGRIFARAGNFNKESNKLEVYLLLLYHIIIRSLLFVMKINGEQR